VQQTLATSFAAKGVHKLAAMIEQDAASAAAKIRAEKWVALGVGCRF
jgi:hypothetical protein